MLKTTLESDGKIGEWDSSKGLQMWQALQKIEQRTLPCASTSYSTARSQISLPSTPLVCVVPPTLTSRESHTHTHTHTHAASFGDGISAPKRFLPYVAVKRVANDRSDAYNVVTYGSCWYQLPLSLLHTNTNGPKNDGNGFCVRCLLVKIKTFPAQHKIVRDTNLRLCSLIE
jgi:hypothetical protein